MDQVLQWWGGVFYLLNKVFLSFSERVLNRGYRAKARKWRIVSWAIYLAGLPPWVTIFMKEHNWIAAFVETSGAPAMLLGLVTAIRGTKRNEPRWLLCLAVISAVFGFVFSLWDFGGLTTLNQWLEIILVASFLIGTFLLAREMVSGYLWYVLMHLSCGWLMWIQGYHWLFLQQVVSLVFITDAYKMTRRRKVAVC